MLGLEVRPVAQLKCICTSAHSVANKHEELEAILWCAGLDLVVTTGTWRHHSYNWSAMSGCINSSKGVGKKGGVVVWLSGREQFDITELGAGGGKVESLWVRIRVKTKVDIQVGVHYRMPDQDEETDEAFYEQLAGVVRSLAFVLMGNCSFPRVPCLEFPTKMILHSAG